MLEVGHLEEPQQAGRNLMKFSKGKRRVMHLRLNNPIHPYKLGTDWRKESFVEEDWTVAVENPPAISVPSQQRRLTKPRATLITAYLAGQGKWLFLTIQHL